MGRKVGMNDMWDVMCHEERKKRCLHLDKYYPPKANWFGGKEERKKGKGKERRKITERKENQQFSD